MSYFLNSLRDCSPDPAERRWVYVPYDQLSDRIGPLSREDPNRLGLVIVESVGKARRRPYHKQKLALLLANQRQFALEQARRGVAIRFVSSEGSFADALAEVVTELGTLRMQEPAERELRLELRPLVRSGALEILPHGGWLTRRTTFLSSQKEGRPYRMDAFYRAVRRETGILMDRGQPLGGKFSFDTENRRSWSGEPPAPQLPTIPIDEVTEEVIELVESRFFDHPGSIDRASLPTTRRDAVSVLEWALDECLEHFGPFEDAFSERSRSLFHTRLAPLMNLHRVTPSEVLDAVLEGEAPLASREGWVRQILGWREFVKHVHVETDGFRLVRGERQRVHARVGDGGRRRWCGEPWSGSPLPAELDGGAAPSHLDSTDGVPPAYWGVPSGLRCLDRIVEEVWETGYTHHIPRLMVLSSLATMLDVSPRELTDWFWVAFADAYDWVVEPNVLGMGTFGAGECMTTKPYVSGAAYLDRMGDSCSSCAFDPKSDCPVTSLYWSFLDRKRSMLEGNPRLRMPLAAERKRGEERRSHDAEVTRRVREVLAKGEPFTPG